MLDYRDRNALALLWFAFMGLIVFPGAFGLVALPPTLERAPIAGHIAGILMVIGCLIGIVSIAWRNFDTSLLLEQLAVGLVALSCAIYIAALVQNALAPHPSPTMLAIGRWAAAWAIGTTFGIGTMCVWRFRQVQRYVRFRKEKQAQQGSP